MRWFGVGLGAALVAAMLPTTALAFGDGIHVVGTDISPGTYRAPGGAGCYWARLSGFGGTVDDIIANANPPGAVIVTIDPSDAGFETRGCGEWQVPIPASPPARSAPPTVDGEYSLAGDLLAVVIPFTEDMADIADGFPGSVAAFGRKLDSIADDLQAGLLTIHPHPCQQAAYAQLWSDVGGLRLWAELIRNKRSVNAIKGATFITTDLQQWFLPDSSLFSTDACPPELLFR